MLIAAACSRPFVRAAAAAGYEVIAADAFCDADTRAHAAHAIQLNYSDGGFERADLRRHLLPLLSEDIAFTYGSGFEVQPQLLEEIAQRSKLLGNTAQTVRKLKDPDRFFSLLRELGVPCPETREQPPAVADGWVVKRVGGSGGTHVQVPLGLAGPECYYQRMLPGRPCSLLFLADGNEARAVGYHEQWLAPTPVMPFRYGGACSQPKLPDAVCRGMLQAAQELTQRLGLRGLNSLDCMVAGERYWVLEVNPRLSATFALHDLEANGANLFMAHVRACAGEVKYDPPQERAAAHLIYYAPADTEISPAIEWPAWVQDIPPANAAIRAGEPLCTITATAVCSEGARQLADLRSHELAHRILLTSGY